MNDATRKDYISSRTWVGLTLIWDVPRSTSSRQRVEQPKSKSTQPRFAGRWATLNTSIDVYQGPLVIPGPPLGPFDARVNFWTYLPTSLFLGALDVINPEMVLGQVGYLLTCLGDHQSPAF